MPNPYCQNLYKKLGVLPIGRTLSLYLFPVLEGDPDILPTVNRHKTHQRMPCLRGELRQQSVPLGEASQELPHDGSADSLVVHLGVDGIGTVNGLARQEVLM